MNIKKLSALVIVTAAVGGGLYYYNSDTTKVVAQDDSVLAKNNKTLVYCVARGPRALSPALVADGTSYNATSRIIYNRLFENEPGSTVIMPALATSYDVSPDGKEYTVHLRKGVKFQGNEIFTPTRDFNADDVVFTFNRMLKDDSAYHNVNNATYPYWNGMNFSGLIDHVEKVDNDTVKFYLKEPNVTFIPDLSMDVLSIYSKEYADVLTKMGHQEYIDSKPVGTGPWKLENVIPDTSLRYTANLDYFRGAPKIGTVIFSITPDSNARISKLLTGACDIIDRPDSANLDDVIAKNNLQTNLQTGLNVAYIGLNTEWGPLKNPEVRKALDMAIDKKAIAKIIYNDQVTVDNHILTPTLIGYDANAKTDSYNPEMAKKLLAEAGYPNGFDIEIFVQPVARTSNPNPRRTAELIQQDWDKIGVHTTLRTTEYQEFIKQTRAGNFQAGTYGWSGDNGDTDNFLAPLLSGPYIGKNNYTRWNNPEFNQLVAEGRVTTDPAKRADIYRKAEQLAMDQYPMIVIGHSKILTIMNQRVKNYKQTPFGFLELYGVDVQDPAKK